MAFDFSNINFDDYQPQVNLVPPRLVLFGEEKIGKTTFASKAPDPIFINAESGTNYVRATRFFQNPHEVTYEDCYGAALALLEKPHNFQTLVIDSIDWIEAKMKISIGEKEGTYFEDKKCAAFGYGNNLSLLEREMRSFLTLLDRLHTERGMWIILLAHTSTKSITDDAIDAAHQKSVMKLSKHAEAVVCEWADCILFARQKKYVIDEDLGNKKTIGKVSGEGHRTLYADKSPAFSGGSRIKLPAEMPLDWDAFYAAFVESINNIQNPENIQQSE